MHSAIEDMVKKYSCKTADDYKNALKEILQEIALLGLFRAVQAATATLADVRTPISNLPRSTA